MSAPTTTTRDALAELVNGGPLPKNPRTVGGIYERDTAYQRADAIIAAGWRAPIAQTAEICPDEDCVRDVGHRGVHVNIAGQWLTQTGQWL